MERILATGAGGIGRDHGQNQLMSLVIAIPN